MRRKRQQVVGVSMVRDEEDIVGVTVRHMLEHVDHVLIADNMSVDGTPCVLKEIERETGRVTVISDDEPAYMQSQKMSGLARRARKEFGADWIVPFDADEIWYSAGGNSLKYTLLELSGGFYNVAPATLYDHVATRFDTDEPDPTKRIGWRRRTPGALPKVACRWRPGLVIEQGNHGCHVVDEDNLVAHPVIVIRHFPYRSPEQVIRKIRNGAAAYKAAGDALPETYGAHWRGWGAILDLHGEDAIVELFNKWHHRDEPSESVEIDGERQEALIYDPAPVRR